MPVGPLGSNLERADPTDAPQALIRTCCPSGAHPTPQRPRLAIKIFEVKNLNSRAYRTLKFLLLAPERKVAGHTGQQREKHGDLSLTDSPAESQAQPAGPQAQMWLDQSAGGP